MTVQYWIMAAVLIWIVAVIVFQLIAERRHPAIGNILEIQGTRLHYITRGPSNGRAVVLLHGNGAMIQDFTLSGLVDLLAEKYHVICFDRPGFGHSSRSRLRLWTPSAQADLLDEALHLLSIEKPIVLGHSWGTLVALAYAQRHQKRLKGLVLVNGYYFPTKRLDVWLLAVPAIPLLGDLLRYTIAPLISFALLPILLWKVFEPQPIPQMFDSEFPKTLALRPKQLRSAAEECAMMIPGASQLAAKYAEMDCPTVIIVGREDRLIKTYQGSKLHSLLRHSVIQTEPDAGHMLHHYAPRRVADAVGLIDTWSLR